MTGPAHPDLSDIHPGDWVDRALPGAWRPYARLARLDRPVGVWLTLFPCLAALIQAAHGLPDVATVAVFSLGALLMRSAGSTVNDIADRDIDGHVERTRLRPLATGQLGVRQAAGFLGAELLLAAGLLLFVAPLTRWLAVCVLPLVFLYPLCKRVTFWPQAVLGAAFNWGILMAWAEVHGAVPAAAVLMWLGTAAWQVGYDTVYAYVDADDDRRLGVKSTALLFGRHGRVCIGLLYALALALWSVGGWLAGLSAPFALGMLAVAVHLAWQTGRLDLARRDVSYGLFVANILTGLLLVAAAVAGVW